ncbi:MAG: hypothetical protein ACRCY4_06440 [Brevinema sp.]
MEVLLPASENNNSPSPRKHYKLILALTAVAVLLWVVPFAFISFNDKALALLAQQFPQREEILGDEGKSLENRIKSPYEIIFSSDLRNYSPYQSITLKLALSDKKSGKVISNLKPVVQLYKEDGTILIDLFNRESIPLQFDSQQNVYEVEFLPGDITYQGRIDARAEVQYSSFSVPIYEDLSLWIANPTLSYNLPTASIFLGLESKEPVIQRRILAPNNKEALFSSIYEWLPILNVDAVILQSAFSKTYGVRDNEIWDEEKLSESEAIATTLAQNNVKSGLIVQMMELDGMDISRLNYTETKSSGQNSPQAERSIVSLMDVKRPQDISQILSRLQKNNDVFFIGLSKMFFGVSYNNELRSTFNEFRKNTPVDDTIFHRWKEYKAVDMLRKILSSVEKDKPYFMTFTHNDLLEIPNALNMAFAAGVSFVILDVKASAAERQSLMERLRTITFPYRNRVVFSLQIDYNDFAGGNDSPIEVWKDNSLMWARLEDFQGLYVNDLYKAMFGRRGSYPAFEWMLGIASMTSAFKQSGKGMPLVQKITAAQRQTTPLYQLFFELRNTGLNDITNMSVDLMPTVDFATSNTARLLTFPLLKQGEIIRTNIVLSNITLKPNVLQQKYRFLGIHTEYISQGKRTHQVEFLSFEDPNAEADRPYQNVVVTNRPVAPDPVQERPVPPPALPETPPTAETQAATPTPRRRATPVAPTPQTNTAPETNEEPKKLSFAERQRLRRLERQREKEAEEN